jgi:hypothetical protein
MDCITRLLILARAFYAQPPLKLQLAGQIEQNHSFFRAAMHQHQYNTYLALLDLHPINGAGHSYKQQQEKALIEYL